MQQSERVGLVERAMWVIVFCSVLRYANFSILKVDRHEASVSSLQPWDRVLANAKKVKGFALRAIPASLPVPDGEPHGRRAGTIYRY